MNFSFGVALVIFSKPKICLKTLYIKSNNKRLYAIWILEYCKHIHGWCNHCFFSYLPQILQFLNYSFFYFTHFWHPTPKNHILKTLHSKSQLLNIFSFCVHLFHSSSFSFHEFKPIEENEEEYLKSEIKIILNYCNVTRLM